MPGKISLISKFAYGMGDVGCNFSWMFVGNFLMIFYTDVFGISMGAVATLMLLSRFWDAINDPVIGSLTDKTHSRWGRFRPWLLFGAPITALLLVLTFWAHPDWSQTAKVVYMAITYCLLVLGYTCVNLPYGTLCGAMTQDIDERAQLNTSRSVSAMIAIGVINIITVPLIGWLGNDNPKQGYLSVAVIYGLIFRRLPPLLLPQDAGGGDHPSPAKTRSAHATESHRAKPSLPVGALGATAFRLYPLWTQRRHALLFHLRGGIGQSLLLLLHGDHRALDHRCRLLPAGVPMDRQQGMGGFALLPLHGNDPNHALLLQP